MTAQGYKYLSAPSAHTVGILLFTWCISTSLSRIAIHKGLPAHCDSTRASRTSTVIFVSWALCGLSVEFIVFHYMIFALGINTICFKLDFCLSSTSRQATLLYSSTIPQGCYSQNVTFSGLKGAANMGIVIMPPPLGAGGIMFSGCPSIPSVRPSKAWNTLFWLVHGSVGPPDQP